MKQWRQREPAISYDEEDSLYEKLAKINGIKDVKKFLNPSIEDTHAYSLLKNVEEAVNQIHKHTILRSKIIIYADADFDGSADSALLFRYLRNFTNNIEIIHVQRSDGHSLNLVEDKIPNDTGLLIVVDSSTNDVEACQRVSEKGIPIIIIDHHEWEGIENPYALIVNPKMPECKYPNKEMSGTLTTLKVCMAMDDFLNTEYSNELLDLAGFSLLADAMSALEPENRYYIKYALENVTNTGMRVLMEELKIDFNKLNSTDFLYTVSPCVTAITRMNKLELAIQLLISDDVNECRMLAKEFIKANETRKKIQREAIDLVKPQVNLDDKIIVVVEPSIGKSFNGVVAAKVAEEYQRPVIVLGHKNEEDKKYSGSYRSHGDFSVRDFLGTVNHALYAAGHPYAGGTSCWKSKLQDFKNEINDKLKDVEFDSSITYDLEFDLSEINEDLINKINTFYKISGKGIQPSKFLIKDLFSLNKKALGSGDTLKSELCAASDTWFVDEDDYDSLETKLVAMKFKTNSEFIENFPVHQPIEIVGTLNTNIFTFWKPTRRTVKTKQIFIEDYRITE